MKSMMRVAEALLLAFATLPATCAGVRSPVTKVLHLLSDLQSKIIAEGEEATKIYTEFSEWCEERSKNLGFEIKTGKGEVADLKAAIEEETATMATLDAKLEKLAASTASNEKDLKAATEIRTTEAGEFDATQKELTEVIDTLQRAISILQREMQQGGAALVQLRSASSLADALSVMVQASALSSADAKQLTALIQGTDAESNLGAPSASVYEGHSGGILGTLEDLLDKAESQLAEARKKETAALHNYQMLKTSLEDEMKYAAKEMAEAKHGLAGSGEKKASAEGDLQATSTELKEDITTLADLHHNCMTKAQDYEAELKSRGEELKALAEAKKVISEKTAPASKLSYGLTQVALFQVSRTGLTSSMDLARYETIRYIRDLSHKQHSPALAQLAAKIAAVTQAGSREGDDPFAKVKGLISEMIERLEEDAQADATHKAYCDKEMAETSAKKEDKTAEIEKLSTKIDGMTSRSSELKGEVAALQKALAELVKAQAEMDKLRQQEKADFTKAKAELEEGLAGVKVALKVLREYYSADTEKSHAAAEGAGAGIIGLLEVVESDFSTGLVERTSSEEAAQLAYTQETKDNEIEKAAKEQDVKYKTKEASALDKAVAEATSDKSSVESELEAIEAYLKSLEAQCVAKAETFEERKARFAAELAGLKEALQILEGEAVLLQQHSSHRTLRIVRDHGF